jgi:hypothetical protein
MAAQQQREEWEEQQRQQAQHQQPPRRAPPAPPLLPFLRRLQQHPPGWAAGALRMLSWQSTTRQSSIAGGIQVDIPLEHPTQPGAPAGKLRLRVGYRPSSQPGAPRMRGPVRFRQNLCAIAGLLLGKGGRDEEVRRASSRLEDSAGSSRRRGRRTLRWG